MRSGLDLKDRLDFHGGAGGQLGEAEGAAGVVAIAFLAEDLFHQLLDAWHTRHTTDHDDFVKVGGELYRQHAEDLLKQALGTRPNKEAFLQVSAMVLGFDILPRDRTTFELYWHNVVGGSVNDYDKNLPMPVWQCLMRYFSASWRDPITTWEAATAKYLEDHLAMLSYSDSELVPFPAE